MVPTLTSLTGKEQNSIQETDIAVENLPSKKNPGPHGFIGEFYQTLKEEMLPSPQKLFQKRKEYFPTYFEASITLVAKPD